MPPKRVEEKELLSWRSKSRPFKRRSRDFYVTLVSIAVLLGLLLFIIEGFLPVLLIGALVFLFWVLSTVEPDEINYTITNLGIHVGEKRIFWEELGRFWITNRFGHKLLVLETAHILGRMEIVVDNELAPKIVDILSDYLINEEVPPGAFDKAANWASKRLPQN